MYSVVKMCGWDNGFGMGTVRGRDTVVEQLSLKRGGGGCRDCEIEVKDA